MKTRFWIGVSLSLLSALACAQYKYIGPDGKVVYSDTPPPANTKGVQKTNVGGGGSAAGSSGLPFAVQQAARNFPVVLFTAPGCAACDLGRSLLSKRGVPFSEKTVKSADDTAVLKDTTGATSIPVMLIGKGKQVGFESGAWTYALDAAGYPETSQLPANYKAAAATAAAPEKPAPTAEAKPKPDAAPSAPEAPAAQPAGGGERPGWFKGF